MLNVGELRKLIDGKSDDATVPLYVKYGQVDSEYIFLRLDAASTVKPLGVLCNDDSPPGIYLTCSLVEEETIDEERADDDVTGGVAVGSFVQLLTPYHRSVHGDVIEKGSIGEITYVNDDGWFNVNFGDKITWLVVDMSKANQDYTWELCFPPDKPTLESTNPTEPNPETPDGPA